MTEPTVDVVEEIDVDDARRQAFLQQVYDRYEQTRNALVTAKGDPAAADDIRQLALANLADLLGQLRPMLTGTRYWTQTEIGRIDTGDDVLVLEGLRSVFDHRDGVEVTVERDTPGRGTNKKTDVETHPLPLTVIETAVNTVAEFMHEHDLLVAHTEEAAAKDDTPL
jgi:hypothetical protein